MDKKIIKRVDDQFENGNWKKFLNSVNIKNLRGIDDNTIKFDYPITVIVGENGSRKSTILKSAASAYLSNSPNVEGYYPSSFFVDTAWDTISNVTLEYEFTQGDQRNRFKISKGTSRWRYPKHRPKRDVFFFDVSRTLPIDATIGYSLIAKRSAKEVATSNLSEENIGNLSKVLGKEYTNARFASTDKDTKKEVGLLKRKFGEFSQFHQGTGEGATLDLFKTLQRIPNNSLLIIDEVEASLHPRAQRRLMEALLELSLNKKIQIILSTHSPYILSEVPPKARILLLQDGDNIALVKGPSTEFALSRIDDKIHHELHVFVEDVVARTLFIEIIRKSKPEFLSRINVIAAGSESVLKSLAILIEGNNMPYKSLVILDGDMSSVNGTLKLPGTEAPEIKVFSDLKERNWPNISERFGIGAGNLFSYLESAMSIGDHHQWCSYVGDRILKSRESVWEILSEEWVELFLQQDYLDELIEVIESKLS